MHNFAKYVDLYLNTRLNNVSFTSKFPPQDNTIDKKAAFIYNYPYEYTHHKRLNARIRR